MPAPGKRAHEIQPGLLLATPPLFKSAGLAVRPRAKEAIMSVLVFFSHGEKGGVGKTAVASAAIDLMLASGRKVAVVEGDVDNADIARRYEGAVTRVKKVRLSDPSEYQRAVNDLVTFVAEIIETAEADAVVVNMPANASTTVDKDIAVLSDAVADLGALITVAISSGNTDQSIERTVGIVRNGVGTLGDSIVLAPEFLKDENLVSKLSERGLEQVDLYPRLSPDTMQIILDHPQATLASLAQVGGPIKSPIQRIRITQYLRQARDVLMPVMGGLVDPDVFGSKR